MAITNSIENFRQEIVPEFIEKAEALKPELIVTKVKPVSIIDILKGEEDWEYKKINSIAELRNKKLGKGDRVCIDFGDHRVGYVTIKLSSAGSPPDAPAYIRLKFAEHICEIAENSDDYNGSISSSWIQEEYIHIDVLPAVLKLPRRYAFRFMEFYVKDTSPKYTVVIDDVKCDNVSSADMETVERISCDDEDLIKIDRISLKTMQDCMQSVFEDGPKRDRRLWIGDLRLQALADYETFKNYDLVKRCLYLFAGLRQNEGRVGACLFIEPKLLVDDTALFDYSLFFISCLYDYYYATDDRETLEDLWKTAVRQIELASERVGDNGVVRDSDDWWCFIDWHDELNKQAPAQAVFIYTLKQAKQLARELSDTSELLRINTLIEKLTDGAKKHLWNKKLGFFTSGKDHQVSWASQVWFALSGVFDSDKNAEILARLIEQNPPVNMVTPYMYHYFIDALISSGMKDEALSQMKRYWGAMADDGADCFYELYNPDNKFESPYGSRIINSYCHAWSGTPTYFIRKYFLNK